MKKHKREILHPVFLNKIIVFSLSLILFMGVVPVQAAAQPQDITMSKKNVTIISVIKEIEKNTKYKFFYNNNQVNVNAKVSVQLKNAPIETLMNELLKGTRYTYQIENDQVMIYDGIVNKASVPAVKETRQQQTKVNGIVVDERGEAVIGASVLEKGTTNGVITNLDGKFSLVLSGSKELVISYIGYVTANVKATEATLRIVLKENAQNLEEVVVVGFGAQKKVNLTGAVSSVKMGDVLGNRPVTSAVAALEGSVPGLQINKVSGKPGVSVNANIRGVTSINGGGPLVLVDNVPMDLDLVDPADIESVSVLKDAAASAIYGARAAFGVILVTTKQGKKESPTRVTYSNSFAFSNVASRAHTVTPRQTLNYFKDLGVNTYWSGQNLERWMGYMDEYESGGKYQEGYVWGDDGYRYNLAPTDSYADMLDKFGFQQTHNLSVQGGSARSTYRVSFGMVNEDGVLVTDKDSYKRYNASAFLSMDAAKWLTAQMDTKYTSSNMSTATGNVGNANLWGTVKENMAMTPLGYGTQTKDGTLEYPFSTPRHAIELHEPKINRVSNIRLLGRVIITPLKGWNITGEYTFNRNWTSERTVNKYVETIDPDDLGIKKINKTSNYNMFNAFDVRNVINVFSSYQHKFTSGHEFSVMGGFNQEEYHFEKLSGTRKDLIDPNLPSLGLATGDMTASDEFNELALRSLFFRVNYSYKSRYLFEANGRYDGSSRFPKKDRFGFFPSFSGAWRISEEAFMENVRKIADNIKIRTSWGNIGNQNTGGYYPYLSTIDTNKPKWLLPGSTDWVTSLTTPGLVSSALTWEKVSTLDFGLDFLLLGKLSFTGDYYIRDTKDMLGPSSPLPSVLGTSVPKANVASLKTKGWEIALEWKDRIGENWNYRLGFNLYDSQTEITDYYNPTGLLTSKDQYNREIQQLREGMKFGEIWGYQTDRFLTKDDFNTDGTVKPGIPLMQGQKTVYPGDIIYVDHDKNGEISKGDNTIDNKGDQVVIGNRTPRFQYGITGGLQYKDFDFSFFFNGVGKRDMWLDFFPSEGSYVKGIQNYQLDYWTEERPNAFYPRISEKTSTGSNRNRQTKYVSDASYLRLKNLTVGYNVPKAFCNKYFIQNLRLFFSAENLFTLHHLPDGYLPDAYDSSVGSLLMNSVPSGDSNAGNVSYPLMRQYAFGLSLT
ncbi:MAG: TonB-dependent receptor, partial [Bacteroides sp.]